MGKENKAQMLVIRDVTAIIKSVQKLCDTMYQDSIEAIFSHEQMTPLNCIIGNSKLVMGRFIELNELFKKMQPDNKAVLERNKETFMLMQAIEQSGVAMWFYNQN